MVPIGLVHTDPVAYPDPMRFDPGRFENGSAPAPFIPFGAGPRVCHGEVLARREIELAAEHALSRFDLALPRPARAPSATRHRTGAEPQRARRGTGQQPSCELGGGQRELAPQLCATTSRRLRPHDSR
jgi:cytochrome P450